MPITSARLLPFKRKFFVETGTYDGDGIKAALGAGFEKIWSVELNERRVEACRNKFVNNSNVTILQGTSGDVLPSILSQLTEPATLWLDAHGEVIPGQPNPHDPIVEELNAIKASGVSDHILLLDDMWESDTVTQTRLRLRERLLSINPKYKIYFIDGQQEGCEPTKNTIMVGAI